MSPLHLASYFNRFRTGGSSAHAVNTQDEIPSQAIAPPSNTPKPFLVKPPDASSIKAETQVQSERHHFQAWLEYLWMRYSAGPNASQHELRKHG